MIPTTAYVMAAGTVIMLPIVVAILRWPGRTIGFGLAMLAWVVAGWWPGAIVVGATAVGAIARRHCNPRRSAPCRRRGFTRVGPVDGGLLVDGAAAAGVGPRLDVLAEPQDDVLAALDPRRREVLVPGAVHADGVAAGQAEQLGHGAGVDEVGGVDQLRHTKTLVDDVQLLPYVGGRQHIVPPAPRQRPGGRTREGLALMPTGDDTRPGAHLRHRDRVEILRSDLRPSATSDAVRQADDFPPVEPFAGVDAWCLGCGLAYVVDDLRLAAVVVDPGPVRSCGGCGRPVHLVAECEAA